jgi:hypothetical protein
MAGQTTWATGHLARGARALNLIDRISYSTQDNGCPGHLDPAFLRPPFDLTKY